MNKNEFKKSYIRVQQIIHYSYADLSLADSFIQTVKRIQSKHFS